MNSEEKKYIILASITIAALIIGIFAIIRGQNSVKRLKKISEQSIILCVTV